jgi:hypothetical protein
VDRDENRAPGVARGDAFGLKAILQGRLLNTSPSPKNPKFEPPQSVGGHLKGSSTKTLWESRRRFLSPAPAIQSLWSCSELISCTKIKRPADRVRVSPVETARIAGTALVQETEWWFFVQNILDTQSD